MLMEENKMINILALPCFSQTIGGAIAGFFLAVVIIWVKQQQQNKSKENKKSIIDIEKDV